MDDIVGLLDGPRARGAFALKVVMSAPWSIAVRDEAPLTVIVVSDGRAVFTTEAPSGQPSLLGQGDVVLVRGPAPYVVADAATTPTSVIVLPGQVCVSPSGEPMTEAMTEAMTLGVNTWGNDAAGDTSLVIGTYHGDGEVGRRLIDALPDVIVLRSSQWDHAVVDLLVDELASERPGQRVTVDRLLDVVVVGAIRAWAASGGTPPWFATDDECVRAALQMIHDRPDEAWTVAGLARTVDLSRAAFARRFQHAVGQPPIAYLTEWRMMYAADLLRSGGTVTAVAVAVGYPSPFTFSTAFKRHFGRSPRHYTRQSHDQPARLVPA